MKSINSPLISVVIPAYNRENTILYCLESVIKQTYSNLEIIVVDDCSTDKTIDIVKTIKDNRIKIINHESNSGAQVARNTGIKNATAEWIAFHDSDDEWLENKIERQIEELRKVNFDKNYVVHSAGIWYYHAKDKKIVPELPIIEGNEAYKDLLKRSATLFPTILCSRSIIEKAGYLDTNVKSYQEWDTSIILAKQCSFIYINEPLFIYHIHEDERISKDIRKDIDGYQYIIDKYESDIKNYCGLQVWVDHLYVQMQKCLNAKIIQEADEYFKIIKETILNEM